MTVEAKILHIALTYKDKKKSDIFFNKILNIPVEKEYTLTKDLSNNIFGINEEVLVIVYSNKYSYFEIFIADKKIINFYNHICIEISDYDDFLNRCIKNNLKPLFVKKGLKNLIFIKDFENNIFEIKLRKN